MNVRELTKESFRQKKWNYYSDEFIGKLNIEKPNDCREFIRMFFAVSVFQVLIYNIKCTYISTE